MERMQGLAVVVVAGLAIGAGLASAGTGYATSPLSGASGGTSAVAYAPDGTLYCVDMIDGSVLAVGPDGSTHNVAVSGASLFSVGGMCVSGDGATLYVTDNKGYGDGLGELYAVDVATGAAVTLASGLDTIENVAVRPTGELFVSEATGLGSSNIYRIDPIAGGIVETVVTGLDFGAGLGFDSAGNLIYQQATYSFIGEVYRLPITDGGGGLSYGTPELLATGLSAAFSMAVDSEDDVFVTGSGGLFELDRDAGGAFLGTATVIDPQGFSTEAAFWAGGSNPFEPYAGFDGGKLTYIPSYGAATLTTVTTVPEPAALALLGMGAVALLRRRR
ncbi:MAG TPA: SMP-30/gluconolactonase/LRE family protein [Phycisphaerae bacterium]|nr:SMP-30/gluconolactonase/LRE family protein [Phycisphaerae bacterium]